MPRKTSSEQNARAKRYGLHFPVYFRELDSTTWLAGTTENISSSGVLFQSPSSLALNTILELKLQIVVGGGGGPAEIHSKGDVVRLEQRNVPENPIALAVAMRDCRIVRLAPFDESTAGSNEGQVWGSNDDSN